MINKDGIYISKHNFERHSVKLGPIRCPNFGGHTVLVPEISFE